MKRLFMCSLAALALTMACNADTVVCSNTLTSITVGGVSPTITCGPLTFTNFGISNLSGENSGRLDINGVTFNTVTGIVVFNENPNLGSGGHMDLFFTINGPLSGIDLTVGDTLATVTERACANPIPMTGILAGVCTNPAETTNATPLGQVTVHSGDTGQPLVATFPTTSPVYIFKDIAAATGGALSTLNESFHDAPSVPEPNTMMLSGGFALLALGLLKKRRKA